MSIHMEHTKIPARQTVGELQNYLADRGARSIWLDYDDDGEPSCLQFELLYKGKRIPFQLPARKKPIFMYLNGNHPAENQEKYAARDREKAVRVAWRQIFRWIQAQFALIGVGMVEPTEIFLPFMASGNGQTLYQRVKSSDFMGYLPEKAGDDEDEDAD